MNIYFTIQVLDIFNKNAENEIISNSKLKLKIYVKICMTCAGYLEINLGNIKIVSIQEMLDAIISTRIQFEKLNQQGVDDFINEFISCYISIMKTISNSDQILSENKICNLIKVTC